MRARLRLAPVKCGRWCRQAGGLAVCPRPLPATPSLPDPLLHCLPGAACTACRSGPACTACAASRTMTAPWSAATSARRVGWRRGQERERGGGLADCTDAASWGGLRLATACVHTRAGSLNGDTRPPPPHPHPHLPTPHPHRPAQDWYHHGCVGLKAPGSAEGEGDDAPDSFRCPLCCMQARGRWLWAGRGMRRLLSSVRACRRTAARCHGGDALLALSSLIDEADPLTKLLFAGGRQVRTLPQAARAQPGCPQRGGTQVS